MSLNTNIKSPFKPMNIFYSDQVNDNLYLSNYCDEFTDKFFDTIVTYDKYEENSYIMSVGHNFVSEYMYVLNNNTLFPKKEFKTTLNKKSTNKEIVFFIIFEKLPGNVTFDTSNFNYSLTIDEMSHYVSEVKKIALMYTSANIRVVSNVFKYFTEEEKISNELIKKLNNISDNVVVDMNYDINAIDTSEVAFVCTNKVSYLFKKCVNQKLPIVLTTYKENRESYIQNYFNNIKDNELKIFEETNELNTFVQYDSVNEEIIMSMYNQMHDQINEIYKIVHTENNSTYINNILLFNKGFMYKDWIDTEANKKYINLGFDIDNTNSIVLTTLHNNFHRNIVESNNRWLGFDGDNFTNYKLKEQNVRFYYKSYNNPMDIYKFESVSEIENKFGFDKITDMNINKNGKILIFLDSCTGINYSNIEEWATEWKKVFDGIISLNLSNVIQVRPYRKSNSEEFDAVYDKYFSNYKDKIFYDSESREKDILELLDEEIYFCVKRQGPMFGKCFINGRLLLSALSEEETKTKTDYVLTKQYEYNLHKLLKNPDNFESALNEIKDEYVKRKLDILKLITSYLVSINDIKNGYFFKTILNK